MWTGHSPDMHHGIYKMEELRKPALIHCSVFGLWLIVVSFPVAMMKYWDKTTYERKGLDHNYKL